MKTKLKKTILWVIISLALMIMSCALLNQIKHEISEPIVIPHTNSETEKTFCQGALTITHCEITCNPVYEDKGMFINEVNAEIANIGTVKVEEAKFNFTLKIEDKFPLTIYKNIGDLHPGQSVQHVEQFHSDECYAGSGYEHIAVISEEKCVLESSENNIETQPKTEKEQDQDEAQVKDQETEDQDYTLIQEQEEISQSDILPKEGLLNGNLEQQLPNQCYSQQTIQIDLKERTYTYMLNGGCDYSEDFMIVDTASGNGTVYDDAWFEGTTTYEQERFCRPGKNCLDEWLIGEKGFRSLVGFIDISASLISICEFFPDKGAGVGWDLSTFKSFAEEKQTFICPTEPDYFEFTLSP